jgi:iron complex outermembrane receptor protein
LRLLTCSFLLASVPFAPAAAGDPSGSDPTIHDLKALSVEQLFDVEVYSASRYLEPTRTAPNAVFVITGEDLRRSLVTNVPDALRLVPGVQVGRVDANKFAVSIRGFNSREANKLLVLVDGRSIYDPLFSGMLWESQDFLLENIDRIEVIRGPGGTLWGANAFHGVINIITKHARETQGGLVVAAAGDEERYTAAVRHGWQLAEKHHVRAWAKSFERDTGFAEPETPYDASRMSRGGFRWDRDGARDHMRVSGELFTAKVGIREDPTFVQDVEHRGQNLLARWERRLSSDDGMLAQLYYDHVSYRSFSFDQERHTYDVEAQHRFRVGSRHRIVWGAGHRHRRDLTESVFAGVVDVLPLRRRDDSTSVFFQDTIALVADELHLVAGMKYESTDYADSEWLPNLRLAWTPTEESTTWVAVSEAVRVPSRLEADLTFFNTVRIGDGFESERVLAYEAGHRQLVTPRLWCDVALFYNDYDELRTSEGGFLRNLMHGHTVGAELAARWEPLVNWRLDLAYAYLRMALELDAGSASDPGQVGFLEGLSPEHAVSLRSAHDFPHDLGLDAIARFVDELPSIGVSSYTELDLGLRWAPTPDLELSVVGRDLLDSHHPEQDFALSASGMPTDVERSFYGKVVWRY